MHVRPNAKGFFLKRGQIGCLLLHGGTGTPSVMRSMGEFLAEKGISALGKRLKGFGTSPEDWLKTTHLDWILSAEEGISKLEHHCKDVFIAGLSMGGALTLYLAAKHQNRFTGIIPICAPAGPSFLSGFRKRFQPLAKEDEAQPNVGANDIKDQSVKPGGYSHFYPSLFLEWADLVEKATDEISAIKCPVLIIQAKNDHVVNPRTADWIYEHVSSDQKELLWLESSYHMATIDVDKEIVFREVVDFIFKVAE